MKNLNETQVMCKCINLMDGLSAAARQRIISYMSSRDAAGDAAWDAARDVAWDAAWDSGRVREGVEGPIPVGQPSVEGQPAKWGQR